MRGLEGVWLVAADVGFVETGEGDRGFVNIRYIYCGFVVLCRWRWGVDGVGGRGMGEGRGEKKGGGGRRAYQ